LQKIDQLVRDWANSTSPQDPSHKTTIRQTTTAKDPLIRVEHTIGLYIDKHGVPKRTKTFTGDLDSTAVDWTRYESDIGYVVGTAHTHPGGELSEHFSANTPRRPGDEKFGRDFLKDNQQIVFPGVGVQMYLVHSGGILNWNVARNVITVVPP